MESKIEATDRLRQEGRWEDASSFRDQVRQEMKAGGATRNEANEQAWIRMLERFPPLDAEATGNESEQSPSLEKRIGETDHSPLASF